MLSTVRLVPDPAVIATSVFKPSCTYISVTVVPDVSPSIVLAVVAPPVLAWIEPDPPLIETTSTDKAYIVPEEP